MKIYDILIIGAGVVGTSIARELSRYNLDILIVDKNNDISGATSKANSGIIHAGYDAKYNKLKGKLNARGNEMYDKVSKELDIKFQRIGSLVLAFNDMDIKKIYDLYENGKKLDIKDLSIIDKDDILKLQKNINKNVLKALYAPTAGIVDPWEVALGYILNAVDNGVNLMLNFKVKDIIKQKDFFIVKSDNNEIKSKIIINASGVNGDDIYNLVHKSHFKINPVKGEYFVLDKSVERVVDHILFPTPTDKGKGVLLVPTVDGNVLVGPNSYELNKNYKDDISTTKEGLDYVFDNAKKLIKDIPISTNIRTFAGIRAKSDLGDFIIEESEIKNFINVVGISSPGLSSVPMISNVVVDIVGSIRNLEENKKFNPILRRKIRLNELTIEERNNLIKGNSKYGKIICRCELISEQEIIDSIKLGATSINAVKRRTRAGAGRCQGGFCMPHVMSILGNELNISNKDVLLENEGSNIIVGKTKDE